jgi:hypothetical protein
MTRMAALGVPFLLFLLLLSSPHRAAAAPRSLATDDALADGEIDPEDLVARATVGRAVLPLPSSRRRTWLSLVGFAHRNTISQQEEVGGLVVVGLPLEKIVRPSTRAVTTAVTRAVAIEGGEATLALTSRLARSCVSAAWRAAGIGPDDARLESIVSRARWSAVLPEARLRAVRFEDARLSTDTGTDSARWRDSAGANVGFEGRLTWRLDRILYADDEPAFERMKLERHDARARIASRTLEALFHWQRAWIDLRSLSPLAKGTREEIDAALRVLEAESALDVLTGGWFGTARPQRVNVVVPEGAPSDL